MLFRSRVHVINAASSAAIKIAVVSFFDVFSINCMGHLCTVICAINICLYIIIYSGRNCKRFYAYSLFLRKIFASVRRSRQESQRLLYDADVGFFKSFLPPASSGTRLFFASTGKTIYVKQALKNAITLGGSLAVGAVSGFFGGGGGMLCVPLLEYSGLDVKRAHATALVVILPICIVSSVVYIIGGY